MTEYKGFTLWPRNGYGMYTATNYSGGYGQLAADTLAGLQQLISHTIAEGK